MIVDFAQEGPRSLGRAITGPSLQSRLRSAGGLLGKSRRSTFHNGRRDRPDRTIVFATTVVGKILALNGITDRR